MAAECCLCPEAVRRNGWEGVPNVALLGAHAKTAGSLEAAFLKTLKKLGIEVPNLPTVSHQDLVRRDLAGDAPFRGGRGYRDALLWHNILDEVANGARVHLVTNNSSDFGGGELPVPPRLAKDVADLKGGSYAVLQNMAACIEWLVSEHMAPVKKYLGEPLEKLLGNDWTSQVRRKIESQIRSRSNLDWMLSFPTGYAVQTCDRVQFAPIENAAKLDDATFVTVPFKADVLCHTNASGQRQPLLVHVDAKIQLMVVTDQWLLLGVIPGAVAGTTTGEVARAAQAAYDEIMQEHYADMAADAEAEARAAWDEAQRDAYYDAQQDDRP